MDYFWIWQSEDNDLYLKYSEGASYIRNGYDNRMYIRKVAGSIPDGFVGIFHWHNPSDRTVALW